MSMADRLEAAMASEAASGMRRIVERIEVLTKEKDNMTKHRDRLNQELAKVTDERDTALETIKELKRLLDDTENQRFNAKCSLSENVTELHRMQSVYQAMNDDFIKTQEKLAAANVALEAHKEREQQFAETLRKKEEDIDELYDVWTQVKANREAACIQRLSNLLKESRFYVNLVINIDPDAPADAVDLRRRIEAEIDL